MPIQIPIIDELVHPRIGLLHHVDAPGNPYYGPFIALAPPALVYGAVMNIAVVGAGHGYDTGTPRVYYPRLGRAQLLYNSLTFLAVTRQVTDWTYSGQDMMWEEALPSLFTLFLAPDVAVDLQWLRTLP